MSLEEKSDYEKALTLKTINKHIIKAKYAVRGPIVERARYLKQKCCDKNSTLPFSKVIMCNLGNPQAVGQVPLTFNRQVLAGVLCPSLLTQNVFPYDVAARVKYLLSGFSCNSVGAYTKSIGLENVRKTVSHHIKRRDGIDQDCAIENIFLTAGASAGIRYTLSIIISSELDGILIPLPQYPLYSATICVKNGCALSYQLDESNNWAIDLEKAQNAIDDAKQKGVKCKAIVVINPGNPTGKCFDAGCIKNIIDFAYKNNLVILADEVYQENVYNKKPFVSFRKIVKTHQNETVRNKLELFSFHSTSKGIFAECGLRGGYMQLTNIDKDVRAMLAKMANINLCPNTIGQCMVDLMCNPPNQKDCKQSYALFKKEYDAQYQSLQKRAQLISKAFNAIDNIECASINGALYAFPKLKLGKKAVQNIK